MSNVIDNVVSEVKTYKRKRKYCEDVAKIGKGRKRAWLEFAQKRTTRALLPLLGKEAAKADARGM